MPHFPTSKQLCAVISDLGYSSSSGFADVYPVKKSEVAIKAAAARAFVTEVAVNQLCRAESALASTSLTVTLQQPPPSSQPPGELTQSDDLKKKKVNICSL